MPCMSSSRWVFELLAPPCILSDSSCTFPMSLSNSLAKSCPGNFAFLIIVLKPGFGAEIAEQERKSCLIKFHIALKKSNIAWRSSLLCRTSCSSRMSGTSSWTSLGLQSLWIVRVASLMDRGHQNQSHRRRLRDWEIYWFHQFIQFFGFFKGPNLIAASGGFEPLGSCSVAIFPGGRGRLSAISWMGGLAETYKGVSFSAIFV